MIIKIKNRFDICQFKRHLEIYNINIFKLITSFLFTVGYKRSTEIRIRKTNEKFIFLTKFELLSVIFLRGESSFYRQSPEYVHFSLTTWVYINTYR